jgi:4-diphosphocytidyl-2C-methyl-D-erythritol kinase
VSYASRSFPPPESLERVSNYNVFDRLGQKFILNGYGKQLEEITQFSEFWWSLKFHHKQQFFPIPNGFVSVSVSVFESNCDRMNHKSSESITITLKNIYNNQYLINDLESVLVQFLNNSVA